MSSQRIQIVLDLGSRNLKAGAFDPSGNLIAKMCRHITGLLKDSMSFVLESLQQEFCHKDAVLHAMTGAHSQTYAQIFGLQPVNDIVAAYQGAVNLMPSAGAVLEIAAEHAKFIQLNHTAQGTPGLDDFVLNSDCSAGTGAFLEQEAHRLGFSLEDFGRLALESNQAVKVAGRCTVFAKTDIVHLHQNGIPIQDICFSLCQAVAQNITNELICGRTFPPPLVLVGGVAANPGIQKALRAILGLDESSLLTPGNFNYSGVIGAFHAAQSRAGANVLSLSEAVEKTKKSESRRQISVSFLKPLGEATSPSSTRGEQEKKTFPSAPGGDVHLGIDIGSTTTNIVCISESGDILAKKTLATRGQPLAAVLQCLTEVSGMFSNQPPRTVGVTGSGRKYIAKLVGADKVLNEITAHALGGLHFFPQLDTIFDIGGQDSKFIRIEEGVVTHFTMNKVCSAGTGSFLEEMSEHLGLDIKNGFAAEALRSQNPLDLGERCTVFMSTELMRKLQQGEKREDLAAGLCYSVVQNYLSRVVGRNSIGNFISFQGGVAANAGVRSALENVLQKPVHVNAAHEIAGAVGVALYSSREQIGASKFRGFDELKKLTVETHAFDCGLCANNCRIHMCREESGEHLYSGGLCDRYDGSGSHTSEDGSGPLDLLSLREQRVSGYARLGGSTGKNAVLGIPRALHFFDLIPFWSTFFKELGTDFCFSEPTSRKTIQKGSTHSPTNSCLPLKVAYGHCLELQEKGIERIFVPSLTSLSFLTQAERLNHICPTAQAWPFTARALFSENMRFLTPTLRFSCPHYLTKDMLRFGRSLGASPKRTRQAFQAGLKAQQDFLAWNQQTGQELLSHKEPDKIYAVLLSRAYTVCDTTVRLHLKKIFDELNIVALPLDMIPSDPKYSYELDGMYWYYGKRFLQATEALAADPAIVFIHLSNFGCGTDSFLVHFLRQRLDRRRLLELQIDEHQQFTGINTRLEAFVHSVKGKTLDSLDNQRPLQHTPAPSLQGRKLLIPQMSDHAFAFQAAFQAFGVDAEVLPLPDEESILCGKQSVGGEECLPCPFVIGDMLKYLKNQRSEDPPPTFFMISGDGPCRLGQYPYLQRLVLDASGFEDVCIFDASQDEAFYDRFGILPTPFKRKTWQGVVATDVLFRKWRETRPHVKVKTDFDGAYTQELKNIFASLRLNGTLGKQLRDSILTLDSFAVEDTPAKPIVAVLGENYIRCNSTANGKIADLLEDLGAEAWFPSLYEWVYYGNWTARLHCLYEKQYRKFLSFYLIDLIQHWDEYTLVRGIKNRMKNLKEPSRREMFDTAAPYVPKTFEGETLIEVARTVDFCKKGACGVVHVVPFGCMMGAVVEAISRKVSRDLDGFPTMTLRYDGLDYTSQRSRLEGFMLRVRMWQEKNR